MRKTINNQPAFLLRRYPYKSRSGLLDFLTREYGVVRLVHSGSARRRNRSSISFNPQLHAECLLDWREGRGSTGLANLIQLRHSPAIDNAGAYAALARKLLPLSYMNELVLKFFKPHDPHTELYDCYRLVVQSLTDMPTEALLRFFELQLLSIAGFDSTAKTLTTSAGARESHVSSHGARPFANAVTQSLSNGSEHGFCGWLKRCSTVQYRLGSDNTARPGRGALDRLSEEFVLLPVTTRLALRDGLSQCIDRHIGGGQLKSRQTMRSISELSKSPQAESRAKV